jgi:hypothetical protein
VKDDKCLSTTAAAAVVGHKWPAGRRQANNFNQGEWTRDEPRIPFTRFIGDRRRREGAV